MNKVIITVLSLNGMTPFTIVKTTLISYFWMTGYAVIETRKKKKEYSNIPKRGTVSEFFSAWKTFLDFVEGSDA